MSPAIPPPVPVKQSYTASSARPHSYAHVAYIGAFAVHHVDPETLGAPEDEIDLEAASRALHTARDVEEATSPTVAPGSPFGI